jgi:hypothetical protein
MTFGQGNLIWENMSSNSQPTRCRCAPARTLLGLALAVGLAAGCEQALDVGHNTKGRFPVGAHSPAILMNDSFSDNWSPEFAALFANNGGPSLAGILVNASLYWPDLTANVAGWNDFVTRARRSGLQGLPDVTESDATAFVVPPDRQIESTPPHHSRGAQFIIDKSRELSQPWLPVALIACSQLTDIADAYLIDPTVVDRVVVVAQLGSYTAPKGLMTGPNGDLDPWADWIVAQRFRYVQISAFYDQSADVTADDVPNLPHNALGAWMADKRTKLSVLPVASDQEPILLLAAPEFITTATAASPDTSAGFASPFGQGPPLVPDPSGTAWLVTQIDATAARKRLWQMLNNPATFKP